MGMGREIASLIARTNPPVDGIALWLTGQAGVVLKGAGQVLYLDPYLSAALEEVTRGTAKEHLRLYPPSVKPEQVDHASWVLCTHRHLDHMDPPALQGIAQASPQARFLVPRPEVSRAEGFGIARERLAGAVAGERIALGSQAWVEPVPAAHESFDRTSEGDYPYLGYVIRLGGVTVYHAGDTLVYDGLAELLRSLQVDIAFLPINGRDYRRTKIGLIGNMSDREAADLAAEAGIDILVPVHWGMHAVNTRAPGNLVDYAAQTYPDLRVRVLGCGDGFLYRPDGLVEERRGADESLDHGGD